MFDLGIKDGVSSRFVKWTDDTVDEFHLISAKTTTVGPGQQNSRVLNLVGLFCKNTLGMRRFLESMDSTPL